MLADDVFLGRVASTRSNVAPIVTSSASDATADDLSLNPLWSNWATCLRSSAEVESSKIYFDCLEIGVRYTDLLGLVRACGWEF